LTLKKPENYNGLLEEVATGNREKEERERRKKEEEERRGEVGEKGIIPRNERQAPLLTGVR
jgi:hypothetical protein